jgi:hypothetical protein
MAATGLQTASGDPHWRDPHWGTFPLGAWRVPMLQLFTAESN